MFLIFSANRAGKYFGYARMTGEIPLNTDPNLLPMHNLSIQGQKPDSQPLREQQQQQPYYPAGVSKVYSTAANSTIPIPAGRIVDDSSRGILFWEVTEVAKQAHRRSRQRHDNNKTGINNEATKSTTTTNEANDDNDVDDDYSTLKNPSTQGNNWTIPFKIQWLSPPGKTVPFYKVRSMRNPYNKNQFLKIARDGTEIEPSVGRKLVDLFHT